MKTGPCISYLFQLALFGPRSIHHCGKHQQLQRFRKDHNVEKMGEKALCQKHLPLPLERSHHV
ncbi:hypothetical protein Tsubulata_040501, partial [Turnera subulata]